ncbi:MAG TPA: zinc ribbon domain-containing protein [Usitatibacter sp.]|nr:zinc ribbon domain-containing protein [Usitatibacter sp.]
MPIYEYRCANCGHQQEFLQKLSDAPIAVCTRCGKASFSKMVTAAGFQLKGSGWYATDFKNSGAKATTKSGDGTKSGDAAKSADATKSSEAAKSSEASSDVAKSSDAAKPEAKPSGDAKSGGGKESSAPAGGGSPSS